MKEKAYIVTRDFKAPYVVATGIIHKPQRIEFKKFRKGQVIKGVMKFANGKPAFVLVKGVIPVELTCLADIKTTEIVVSNADGNTEQKSGMPKVVSTNTNPKIKYIDAMLIGAVVGAVGVHFAEKKGYIPNPDQKNKIYGAVAGGLLAWYVVYRQSTDKKKEIKPKTDI